MCHCNDRNETVSRRAELPLGISRGFCLNEKLNGTWKHQDNDWSPLFLRAIYEWFLQCVWLTAIIGHWIEVVLNTVVTASAGVRREGNRVSTKGRLKVQRKICGTAQLFVPTFLPSSQLRQRASLPLWESDLWLYSAPPLRNLIDLLSPLLFDNPPASRTTTCWVLRFSSLSPVQTQRSFIPH